MIPKDKGVETSLYSFLLKLFWLTYDGWFMLCRVIQLMTELLFVSHVGRVTRTPVFSNVHIAHVRTRLWIKSVRTEPFAFQCLIIFSDQTAYGLSTLECLLSMSIHILLNDTSWRNTWLITSAYTVIYYVSIHSLWSRSFWILCQLGIWFPPVFRLFISWARFVLCNVPYTHVTFQVTNALNALFTWAQLFKASLA